MRRRVRRSMRRRNRVHHFKRQSAVQFTVTAGNVGLGAYTFSFSDITNHSEFVPLFDFYRMNKVVVKWVPKFTGTSIAGAGATFGANSNALGQFLSAVDYNDASAPANINTLLEYENCRKTHLNAGHTRVLRPAVQMATYKSTLSTGYSPGWKKWINMSDASVLHYGLKWAIDNSGGTTPISFDCYITYYFSLRQVK